MIQCGVRDTSAVGGSLAGSAMMSCYHVSGWSDATERAVAPAPLGRYQGGSRISGQSGTRMLSGSKRTVSSTRTILQ